MTRSLTFFEFEKDQICHFGSLNWQRCLEFHLKCCYYGKLIFSDILINFKQYDTPRACSGSKLLLFFTLSQNFESCKVCLLFLLFRQVVSCTLSLTTRPIITKILSQI